MKRFLWILLAAALLLCGCDKAGYTQTEQTEAALERYLSAVEQSTAQTTGVFRISVECEDNVVQKKTTHESYVYQFSVDEGGNEQFTYTALDEAGKTIHTYKTTADGVVDETGAPSEDYQKFLKHATNPISNMTLFRMDADGKFRRSIIADVALTQSGDDQVLSVRFHPDKLTDLAVKSAGGLRRTVTRHERKYTMRDGKIAAIDILDLEEGTYNKEKGTIRTTTHVEVEY